MKLIKQVVTGASVFAMAAYVQQAQAEATPLAALTAQAHADATQASSGEATAPEAQPDPVSEIIVTAQRRSENLTKVPIAIAVVSATSLANAGISNVADLQQLVPGFTQGTRGVNSQPTLRGVGTQAAGPGISANVATYVDGYYQPNQLTTGVDLNDVTSVQVLKGPQGTLYGRNATGGAILITTRSPSFTPTADLIASYGRFESFKTSVFATGPLNERLAASVAATYDRADGYTLNIVDGQTQGDRRTVTVRTKLLYKPTDNLKFELAYLYIDRNDPTGYTYNVDGGRSTAALVPGAVITSTPFTTSVKDTPIFRSISHQVSLKTDIDLGAADLTSYTSAAWQHNTSGFEFDGSSLSLLYVNFPSTDRTFQQEFDLSSQHGGPLSWTTGIFMLDDKGTTLLRFGKQAPARFQDSALRTRSIAAFAEGTYNLSDTTHLTAGARLSYDYVTETYAGAPDFVPYTYSTSFTSVTPRLVLRQDLSARQSLYVSYNAGNKAGVYNAQGSSPTPVKPERIDAFEIGYKGGGRGWSANAAAYYYFYKDLQVTSILNNATNLTNAASARIYGAEASVTGEILSGLNLTLGASYVHSRFRDFASAPRYTFDPNAGVVLSLQNASGDPFLNSPDFTGQASLNYEHSVGTGSVELNANYAYRTKTVFDPFGDGSQAAYGVVNLTGTFYGPGKRWGVGLYVKNATNTTYKTQISELPLAFLSQYALPRTYGATVSLHW